MAKEIEKGMGVAGFVLGLLSLILIWVPLLDVALAILGLIFSIIQIKKNKTGLAVAGLVLSIISLVVIVLVIIVLILFGISYMHMMGSNFG